MATNWNQNTFGIIAFIALVFLALGFFLRENRGADHAEHVHTESINEEQEWTCSMHPQIKMPKPGKCPICGMELIPLVITSTNDEIQTPSIQLSPYARKLAQVQTTKVFKGTLKGTKEITGTIAWNETQFKTEPAWFSGRIEKLKVNYIGQYVQKGQIIAEIYSTELYSAAEEWRQANAGKDKQLIQSVRKKLELLGFDQEGIRQLTEVNSERVFQRAKHSGVVVSKNVEEGQYIAKGTPLVKLGSSSYLWIALEIFAQDLPLVQLGQKITMSTESLPGEKFTAKVEFIDPVLDPQTRTVRIRLSVHNPRNLLKPGMLVQGNLEIKDEIEKLYIPETAPLLTGRRAMVYLEETEGVYTHRRVELGELRNGFYEVLNGLTGDETIVKRGAFKLDAAMQLQAKPSMMYPESKDSTVQNHQQKKDKKILPHHPESAKKTKASHSQNPSKSLANSDKQWILEIYEIYLQMQAALASDDASSATSALISLTTKLQKTPHPLQKNGYSPQQISEFEKAARSGNMDTMRIQMIFVSEQMIRWLKEYHVKPKQGAAVYFCPMANNNQGAEWLQTGGDVKNPFYGLSMLTCGEQRQILSKDSDK